MHAGACASGSVGPCPFTVGDSAFAATLTQNRLTLLISIFHFFSLDKKKGPFFFGSPAWPLRDWIPAPRAHAFSPSACGSSPRRPLSAPRGVFLETRTGRGSAVDRRKSDGNWDQQRRRGATGGGATSLGAWRGARGTQRLRKTRKTRCANEHALEQGAQRDPFFLGKNRV